MNTTKLSFFESRRNSVLILICITFIVYFKSLYYDFSPMDEDWLIIRDQAFLNDWSNLAGAFRDAVQGLYYRPVLIVTFILNYHIGHLEPFIYHFTNLLIHAFCVAVLYRLLLELETKRGVAFFLALLFAIHPMTLHAVAWIPGRNDLLLCLFTLLSCYQLVRYIHTDKQLHAALHVIFFMLALFSKENAVFLLPVFVFILYLKKAPDKKKRIALVVVWLLQIALWYFMMKSVIETTLSVGPDLLSSVKGFFTGFLIFIGKMIIPIKQSVSPNTDNSSLITGGIAILLIGAAAYKFGFANKKIALLGLLIYFILLAVPVWFGATSPLGEHLEHRAYSSMIGFIIFAGQLKSEPNSKIVRFSFSLIILVFAVKTFMRMDIYKNGLSYLTEAAQDCPRNYFFHARKGNFLFDQGKPKEALECYNTAISLHNIKAQVFNDRANAYVTLNKKEEAIADYTKAYELGKNPQFIFFRCQAYNRFNDVENAFKDLMFLQECCRDLIPVGLEQEIIAKMTMKRFDDLNKLIEKEPNNALLYVNRAKFYVDARRGPEALADLKKACELEPKNKLYKGYYNELNSSFPH